MSPDLPFLELINTEHIHDAARVTDHLDDPASIDRLARRWGRADGIRPDEVAQLRSLRGSLRRAVEDLEGAGVLGDRAIAEVDRALAAGEARSSLVRHGAGFRISETWSRTDAYVASTFARFLAEGDPRRLKLCSNAHCRWAFYDESKNRSRRWCSSAACGNVARLRSFRERAKGR